MSQLHVSSGGNDEGRAGGNLQNAEGAEGYGGQGDGVLPVEPSPLEKNAQQQEAGTGRPETDLGRPPKEGVAVFPVH